MTSPLRRKVDEARKRRSREALLEAARIVFARKGYHLTLISDIVAEAGVGQGTFYRHFSSKREILERLIDRFAGQLISEFATMSSSLPTNVDEYYQASISAISSMAATVDDNREIMQLIMRDAPTIDEDLDRRINQIIQQFAALARFYLDHAIAHGFARPCRSDVVAQSLVGMGLHLLEAWWRGAFSNISRDDLIREVVTLAFKGFGLYAPGSLEGHIQTHRGQEGAKDG